MADPPHSRTVCCYACTTTNKHIRQNGRSGSDPMGGLSSFPHPGSTRTNNPGETTTTTRCSNKPIRQPAHLSAGSSPIRNARACSCSSPPSNSRNKHAIRTSQSLRRKTDTAVRGRLQQLNTFARPISRDDHVPVTKTDDCLFRVSASVTQCAQREARRVSSQF